MQRRRSRAARGRAARARCRPSRSPRTSRPPRRRCRVRRWPTRNAVTIVVASTATHSTPRLAASTASAIAARNSWMQHAVAARPACRGAARGDLGGAGRPGLASIGQQRHRADHDQHERGERVGAQQPAQRSTPAVAGHRGRPATTAARAARPRRRLRRATRWRGRQPSERVTRQRRASGQRRSARREQHEGRHQSCSSRSSSRSVPPNAARIRVGQHLQHQHDEQHVEGDARARRPAATPGGGEERDGGDAVVQQQEADHLGQRPPSGDEDEEADQHHRQRRPGRPGWPARAPARPAAGVTA